MVYVLFLAALESAPMLLRSSLAKDEGVDLCAWESTLIWEAMAGLASTSLSECLYAVDACASTIFCRLRISALHGGPPPHSGQASAELLRRAVWRRLSQYKPPPPRPLSISAVRGGRHEAPHAL